MKRELSGTKCVSEIEKAPFSRLKEFELDLYMIEIGYLDGS